MSVTRREAALDIPGTAKHLTSLRAREGGCMRGEVRHAAVMKGAYKEQAAPGWSGALRLCEVVKQGSRVIL